jgi:hypothetical protein
MFLIVECKLETDVSVTPNAFFLSLLGLLAAVLIIFFGISTALRLAASKSSAEKKSRSNSYAPSTVHSGSTRTKSSTRLIGLIPKHCTYHGPILAGEKRKSRQGMLPMERFMDESGSQANALFTRADNLRPSLDKGCMCEVGSGVLSISVDE